jgi:hypothetical protein
VAFGGCSASANHSCTFALNPLLTRAGAKCPDFVFWALQRNMDGDSKHLTRRIRQMNVFLEEEIDRFQEAVSQTIRPSYISDEKDTVVALARFSAVDCCFEQSLLSPKGCCISQFDRSSTIWRLGDVIVRSIGRLELAWLQLRSAGTSTERGLHGTYIAQELPELHLKDTLESSINLQHVRLNYPQR